MPAYTTQYTQLDFNAATAVMTVRVDYLNSNLDVLSTKDFRITLPVDSLGNVPTGVQLDDLVNERITRETAIVPTSWTIPVTGVTNAEEIIGATDSIEPSEGIPVLIVPVGSSTGFTASILIATTPDAVALTETIARADVMAPGDFVAGDFILDNGNVNGASLTRIRGISGGAFTDDVEIAMDNTTVPAPVLSAYPYVFQDPLPEGADFNDYIGQYYITHDPITISGSYAIAVFNY